MKCQYSAKFVRAAKAAGLTPKNFASRLRGLLSPSKCRNTKGRIFTSGLIAALSCAPIVSQH